MRSEASGSVFTFLENFNKKIEKSLENMFFGDFGKVLEELDANGPQNQLPRQILPWIDSSRDMYVQKLLDSVKISDLRKTLFH